MQRSSLFASHWLIIGLVHEAVLFISEITNFPFSIRWSEGSRQYYAWLFYKRDFWEAKVELPLIDLSQHLLLGIPNFIVGLPIWGHRLWHVVLWIVISTLSMVLLARRFKNTTGIKKFIFVSWAFLFIYQGPVLYNLLVIVGLMFWGYDNENFRKSTLIVIIASIWAGISRVTWIPMPGTLAAFLYFLETPVIKNNKVSLWKYLQIPFFWFFSGITVGFFALSSYFFLAGFEGSFFSYLPDQQLLWYRLLPNPTYRPGIILGILIVSLPVIILILKGMQTWKSRWHTVRLLGLGSLLLVFFAGGLLASTKIGSSANIHHLDGFMILLLTIASYLYFGGFKTEEGRKWRVIPSRPLAILILVIPVIYIMNSNWGVRSVSLEQGEEDLNQIRVLVQEVADQGEDVLFIAERHLLSFGLIQDVPALLEYEKVMLMEMAMAENDAYLTSFHSDIEELSYGMIVSDILSGVRLKREGRDSLAEENNVWFTLVAQPILCYYEPILTLANAGVELLIPREEPVC
ncbi:MAG: hypothetical protein FVQ83_06595 [Chloroflexi bacterium]|nr:hypothetical protein [Chloroflexota bacterium]